MSLTRDATSGQMDRLWKPKDTRSPRLSGLILSTLAIALEAESVRDSQFTTLLKGLAAS